MSCKFGIRDYKKMFNFLKEQLEIHEHDEEVLFETEKLLPVFKGSWEALESFMKNHECRYFAGVGTDEVPAENAVVGCPTDNIRKLVESMDLFIDFYDSKIYSGKQATMELCLRVFRSDCQRFI